MLKVSTNLKLSNHQLNVTRRPMNEWRTIGTAKFVAIASAFVKAETANDAAVPVQTWKKTNVDVASGNASRTSQPGLKSANHVLASKCDSTTQSQLYHADFAKTVVVFPGKTTGEVE